MQYFNNDFQMNSSHKRNHFQILKLSLHNKWVIYIFKGNFDIGYSVLEFRANEVGVRKYSVQDTLMESVKRNGAQSIPWKAMLRFLPGSKSHSRILKLKSSTITKMGILFSYPFLHGTLVSGVILKTKVTFEKLVACIYVQFM